MTNRFEDNTARRRTLRQEMLARRAALTAAEHASLSAAIAAHLEHVPLPPVPACIGLCWPVKQEPDLRQAAAAWRRRGYRVVLPVVVDEAAPLAFRAWDDDTCLAEDRYGIPTPVTGDFLVPTVLVIPLNAFDPAGYRLGYGGGYFDRTLAGLQPRPLAIGVGFEMNRVDSINPLPHDQPLDWLVTEAGAFPVRP